MKSIFDDVAHPLIQSTLDAKALEQKILMASKGADGDDSVAGGHKAKGVAQTSTGSNSSKKKAAQNYLDMIQMQQRLQAQLNGMIIDLGDLRDDLHKIDLRMADRRNTLNFIEQNVHDASDLIDSNGDYNPRVKALLAKRGQVDLSPDDAYIFITQTLTQDLYDAQATDQMSRDDVADQIRDKQSAIQDKIDQGRALGMDMSDAEREEATTTEFINGSQQRAEVVIEAQAIERSADLETSESWGFLLDETPSL